MGWITDMAAGISKMYMASGGCDRLNACEKCGYLEKIKLKTRTDYRCKLHQSITGEEHPWKASYMACKRFQHKGKPKYKEQADGQLSLF